MTISAFRLYSVKTLIWLVVLGLCGCSAITPKTNEMVQLKLLPPVEGPASSLIKQEITMMSEGHSQQFIAVIRLQSDRLKMMSLLPTGQQLFFLEYNGEKLMQKNFSSMDMPGEDILAIMQLALWPSPSIERHYTKEDGWLVKISAQQRILLNGSSALIKVNYQGENIMIENYLHNYQLKIKPLEK